ncbi:hypothetical protein [Bacillus sp. T33-2]|uniref:hypothetical protein n=1 Tax=Bacillus sp. T33-2 TaxID=2054168 RepID=UPI000C77A5FB|nr:hypothetical protein [Bacillus sp. T33-2]PLR95784.1 hypothetical protein CVD19_13715 [Bacillus sp. T33-2]
MKKYLYSGILLGIIVLAGCSANEQTEEQVNVKEVKTEDATNIQEGKVQPLADSGKEMVSKPVLKLTQEQKEDYYKQYAKIIEQVNLEYSDTQLELVPLNEFKEEEWVEPDEFRRIASDMATMEFTSSFGGDPVE